MQPPESIKVSNPVLERRLIYASLLACFWKVRIMSSPAASDPPDAHERIMEHQ